MLETKKFSSVDKTFGLAKSLMVFHLIDSHLKHFVFKKPLSVQETANLHIAMFGMGCFWGVEKMFWGIDGVSMTAVGYSAGLSDFPDYKSVCSRTTGHSEVVLIHFQPDIISFRELLARCVDMSSTRTLYLEETCFQGVRPRPFGTPSLARVAGVRFAVAGNEAGP